MWLKELSGVYARVNYECSGFPHHAPIDFYFFTYGRQKGGTWDGAYRFRDEISHNSIFSPLMFDMSERNFSLRRVPLSDIMTRGLGRAPSQL